MSSETSMVAASFRLQEWAAEIRECQSRPAGISVDSWCAANGITKANYYYRQPGLNISAKRFSVHVTEATPMTLLAAVLEVIQDAE